MVALSGTAVTAGVAGAADSSIPVRVSSPSLVVVCQWLHHVHLWLAVAGFGLGIWRVRLLCGASWKQFSRLQKLFCFCEKLTLLHLVPIDEAPASSSMLRAVCVLCCCVHKCQQQLSEHRCAGVQIDTFEVGLDFQKELGEVFGDLLASRMMLRNSFATCCGAQSRTKREGTTRRHQGVRACPCQSRRLCPGECPA